MSSKDNIGKARTSSTKRKKEEKAQGEGVIKKGILWKDHYC